VFKRKETLLESQYESLATSHPWAVPVINWHLV